jgi:hypothetical protein
VQVGRAAAVLPSRSQTQLYWYLERHSPPSCSDRLTDKASRESSPTHIARNGREGILKAPLGGVVFGPTESSILGIGHEHRLLFAATADRHRATFSDLLQQPPEALARVFNRYVFHDVHLKLNLTLIRPAFQADFGRGVGRS